MYGTILFSTIQYGDFNRKLDFTRVIDNHSDNTFTPFFEVSSLGGQDKSNNRFATRAFSTQKKTIGTPRNIPTVPCDC